MKSSTPLGLRETVMKSSTHLDLRETRELRRVVSLTRMGLPYIPHHRPPELLSLVDRGLLTYREDRGRSCGFGLTSRGWNLVRTLDPTPEM